MKLIDNLSPDLDKLDRSKKERAVVLDSNRWLEGLSWEQIEQLAAYTDFYYVPKGGCLFNQGDHLPFICIILTGNIDILKENDDAQTKIASIGKGHTIGEMTVIDGEPRSASAVAASECELGLITLENFQRIRKDVPALWGTLLMRFIKTITQRLRRSSGVLVELLDNTGEHTEISLSEASQPDKGQVDLNMLYCKLQDMDEHFQALAEQPLQFTLGEELFNRARKQALVEGSSLNEWLALTVKKATE